MSSEYVDTNLWKVVFRGFSRSLSSRSVEVASPSDQTESNNHQHQQHQQGLPSHVSKSVLHGPSNVYALITLRGRAYTVQEQDIIITHHLPQPPGTLIALDQVSEVGNAAYVLRGSPFVKDASVEAVVLEQTGYSRQKMEKRRKGHRKLKVGHERITMLRVVKVLLESEKDVGIAV